MPVAVHEHRSVSDRLAAECLPSPPSSHVVWSTCLMPVHYAEDVEAIVEYVNS
jgi:hypothetical protein